MTKQIKLAAHFPGVNNTTVWSDPASGSQIDFASFEHLARTAERGKFDFLFLAEGLRLREHAGKILDSDVVGRPNTTTVLAALAAVTTHLGLAGTLSSTFNEPYEVARQVASIDHLSGGRAAWNVVTSPDAWTGAELPPRRLPQARGPLRARRGVPDHRARAVGQLAARDPGGGQGERRLRPRSRQVRPQWTAVRHPRAVHAAAHPAGTADRHPGRRLRRRPRVRREGRRRHLQPPRQPRRRPGVLPRRQAAPGHVRPRVRRAADHAGGDVRPRRHRRRSRGARARDPAPAGAARHRDPVPRAGVEPRPVGLRRRRPAAGDRPRPGRRAADLGPRPAREGSARARAKVAGDRGGEEALDPRAGDRGHRAPAVRRHARRRSPRRSTSTSSPTPPTGSSWCRT